MREKQTESRDIHTECDKQRERDTQKERERNIVGESERN